MSNLTRVLAIMANVALVTFATPHVSNAQTTKVLYDAGEGPATDPTLLPQWSVVGAINGMPSTTTDGNAAWMFGDALVGGGQNGSLNFDFTSMQLYDMSNFGFTLEVEMESLSTGGFVSFGYTGNNFKQTGPDRSGFTPGNSGGVTETITWSFDPLVDATVINSNGTGIADAITAWTGNTARLNLADNTSNTSLTNFKLVSAVVTIGENTGSLNLKIDRNTGEIALTNGFSETALENIIGYSLLSGVGALGQSGWDKQGVGASQLANDNDQWTVLTDSGVSTDLSESVLTTTGDGNGGDLAAMTTWNFGNVLRKSPFANDVAFELLIDDGSEEGLVLTTLAGDFRVEYVGDAIDPADLDANGVVNALDWVKFKAGYGSDVSGMTDLDAYLYGSDINLDGVSDIKDFLAYRDLYAAATGSSLYLDANAVPEPASWVLAMFALLVLGGTRKMKRGGKLLLGLIFTDKLMLNLRAGIASAAMIGTLGVMISVGHTAQATNILHYGYDFTTGTVTSEGNLVNDDSGSGNDSVTKLTHGGLDGGTYSSDIPNAGLLQNTLGIGSVDTRTGTHQTSNINIYNQADILGAGGLTYQAWIKVLDRSVNSRASVGDIIMSDSGVIALSARYTTTSTDFSVEIVSGSTVNVAQVTGLAVDEWVHVAAVFSNVSANAHLFDATVDMYINGGLQATQNVIGAPTGADFTGFGNALNRAFSIGNHPTTIDNRFKGLIFEPIVTLGALDASQFTVVELDPGVTVNFTTGEVKFFGEDLTNLDVTSYSLTSVLGQLTPGNFNSLESQHIGDLAMDPDNGIGFEILSETNHDITEADLTGSTVFDNNTNLSLGNIFNTATNELDRDLALSFTTSTGRTVIGQVIYISGSSVPGDYNGDGVVDAADYTVWRNNLGANMTLPNENPAATTPGVVDAEDYAFWKSQFGSSAASGTLGSATVPEPSTVVLILSGSLVFFGFWCRRQHRYGTGTVLLVATVALIVAGVGAGSATLAAVTNDRSYLLGDDSAEGAVDGNVVGSAADGATFDSAGSVGAGNLQDLIMSGAPTYVDVSNRPGASSGNLGASFGGSDALSTSISMNAPSAMWDNTTFFPGPPSGVIFPSNYEGIFSHGIQLWAKPNQATLGTSTQTLVYDTAEHGIAIAANGNWELIFDKLRLDTGVPVAETIDDNGWAHVMQLAGFSDRFNGATANGGALLVNGVAVIARNTPYDPAATPLVLGAQPAGENFTNYYDGTLDDVRLFLWGDNSDQLGADGTPGGVNSQGSLNADGQKWGTLDLGTDNDWIAYRLAELGVTDRGDVNLSGGVADSDDVTAFLTHWRKQQLINGVQVGDWNSRLEGDLNYDGIVDLRDARLLHNSLLAAGAGGFDFSLLYGGANVPEPASCMVTIAGLLAIGIYTRCRIDRTA
jgi:hypothetical protein